MRTWIVSSDWIRCSNIDLGKNIFRFDIGSTGDTMEAPFLHEKDVPMNKGGALGRFDAERENAEIEAWLEQMEIDEEGGKETTGDEKGGRMAGRKRRRVAVIGDDAEAK